MALRYLLAPGGAFVIPLRGEHLNLSAISQHGIDLGTAVAGGPEGNVLAIRRPARVFIAALAVGQLRVLVRAHVHEEHIPCSGGESAGPGEREKLAVGMPSGIAG